MKKTLIALFALAGAAMGAGEAITLPDNSDFKWIAGSNASGIGVGADKASEVEALATAITSATIGNTDLVGWFGGTGQSYAQNSYNEIFITSSSSFSFAARGGLSGEYVALGVELPAAADSITLSFTTDNMLGYSLWSYDVAAKTATELIGLTYQSESGNVSQTYNTSTVDASQLFVVWTANHPSGAAKGGTTITVSDISLSYAAATTVVPGRLPPSPPRPR